MQRLWWLSKICLNVINDIEHNSTVRYTKYLEIPIFVIQIWLRLWPRPLVLESHFAFLHLFSRLPFLVVNIQFFDFLHIFDDHLLAKQINFGSSGVILILDGRHTNQPYGRTLNNGQQIKSLRKTANMINIAIKCHSP